VIKLAVSKSAQTLYLFIILKGRLAAHQSHTYRWIQAPDLLRLEAVPRQNPDQINMREKTIASRRPHWTTATGNISR
jgi:hypothetical protein